MHKQSRIMLLVQRQALLQQVAILKNSVVEQIGDVLAILLVVAAGNSSKELIPASSPRLDTETIDGVE